LVLLLRRPLVDKGTRPGLFTDLGCAHVSVMQKSMTECDPPSLASTSQLPIN